MTGKYGTRYGASLRKQIKKMEISQHARYTCQFCGKDAVKRTAVGIWSCKGCGKTTAGGAWVMTYALLPLLYGSACCCRTVSLSLHSLLPRSLYSSPCSLCPLSPSKQGLHRWRCFCTQATSVRRRLKERWKADVEQHHRCCHRSQYRSSSPRHAGHLNCISETSNKSVKQCTPSIWSSRAFSSCPLAS